jgi:1A family penicillin-binding protein
VRKLLPKQGIVKYCLLRQAAIFCMKLERAKVSFHNFKQKGKKAVKTLTRFLQISPADILIAIFAIIFTLALISVATYLFFAKDLGSKDNIMNRNNTGLILTDRNGQVFYRFYDAQYRNFTPISQIPKTVQQSVIVAEDKGFYTHPGFSIKGIAGALIADIRKKSLNYGGSTITQQLVKYSLLNSSKSFLRKYQEIILAQEIERRYSKDEILEMYLNSVYFGEGSFGIESAAHTYFNKDVKDLTLAECAYLAGLINAPSKLSPYAGGLDTGINREHFILQEMVDDKQISQTQADGAIQSKLTFNPSPNSFDYQAPHFALMVRDALVQKYGEETITRSGFTVKTSLDLNWQKYAETTVADQVTKLKPNRVSNGAAVVIDPNTGEVRALVGSKDWNDPKDGKVNITTSLRQPGSSFKPIVYSAALEDRIITPSTVLHDSPITYQPKMGVSNAPYSPHDYDNKFRGPVLVRRALVNSLNVPAVEVMSKVGVPNALDMAKRLGITTLGTPDNYGLSLALGAGEVKLLELTNVYATLANGGNKNDVTLIDEIKDKRGKTIYTYSPQPQQVLDPGVAFQIASILSDNATRAEEFGTLLNVSRPAAVKTGTTEDYRDSLTMGFTPDLTVGVWVGNNDGTLMDQIAGSIGAAPIWKALIEKFSEGTPVKKFTPPDDVVGTTICRSNGLLAGNMQLASSSADLITHVATNSGVYNEYFLKGTEPRANCSSGRSQILHIDGKEVKIDVPNLPAGSSPEPLAPGGNGAYQQGGWYPVGPDGKALQYWDGQFYDKAHE